MPPRISDAEPPYPQVEPARRYALTGVIAVQAPSFAPSGAIACNPPIEQTRITQLLNGYAQAVQAGFQSVLLAHGYTLTGPFSDRDQMTYGEKDKAILLIAPRVTFDFACRDVATSVYSEGSEDGGRAQDSSYVGVPVGGAILPLRPRIDLLQKTTILKVSGGASVNARIEVALVEPVTGEKMWIKTLALSQPEQVYEYYLERKSFEVTWPLLRKGESYGTPTTILLADSDGRRALVGRLLVGSYVAQMQLFERYFTPAEITQVIKDAEKVRQLKRY